MELDDIGKIAIMSFGDRAFIGFIMGLLDGVTPSRMREYIKNDIPLLHWATEEDWVKYRKWAQRADFSHITTELIIKKLKKYHPALLGTIEWTPGGMEWLEKQLPMFRKKIGLTENGG